MIQQMVKQQVNPKIDHLNKSTTQMDTGSREVPKHHSTSDIIGDLTAGIRATGTSKVNYQELVGLACYTSVIEPKNIQQALEDEFWLMAMEDELAQFTRNKVWELVAKPSNVNILGTKWIFKNKSNEPGNIIRNKA